MKQTTPSLDQVYKELLESTDLHVDKEGFVSLRDENDTRPATLEGRRIVVPTPQRLRQGIGGTSIGFHPLSENVTRGQSPIIKELRKYINVRLTKVIADLLLQLATIAADTSYHSKLDKDKQRQMLRVAKDADQKTVDTVQRMIKNITVVSRKGRVVSIYLKHAGTIDGKKYTRLATASFPILDAFEPEARDTPEILSVSMRKKDKRTIENLFEFILPGSKDVKTYSRGSDSMIAPYFDALIHSYAAVAWQLNKIVKLFRKHLTDPERLETNLDWMNHLKDLSVYREVIPPLAGNDGPIIKDDDEVVTHDEKRLSSVSLLDDDDDDTPPWEVPTTGKQNEQPTTEHSGQQKPSRSGGRGLKWSEVVGRSHNTPQGGNFPINPQAQQTFNQNNWNPPNMNLSSGQPNVPPGSYAGYHRGVPIHGGGNMNPNAGPAMGWNQNPAWASQQTAQPFGDPWAGHGSHGGGHGGPIGNRGPFRGGGGSI